MDYREYVDIDERYYRPAEVDQLLGDYSKAKEKLGWEPTTSVDDLIKMMVDHDCELGQKEFIIRSHHALNKGGDLNYA